MSSDGIDLAGLHNLPWTQPAPTSGPGDKPDTGPGNGDRPGPCVRPTVEELSFRARRTVADLHAAIAQSRRARGADIQLGEVA
ncbi:hypothetical protein [Micromonospora chersina]|uniref:hypothetical protein n=1 Tax=Micromonospora chersina TaxID=47854 RepID=UPI0037143865